MRYNYKQHIKKGNSMAKEQHLYDELCLSFYNTNRYFHRLYDRILDKYDLSYLQYMSLLLIHQQGQLKLMDIGLALDLSSNTLTPVIEKLVRKDWLVKQSNVADKRIKMLAMTEHKVALFNKILSDVEIMRHELLSLSGRPLAEVLHDNQQLNDMLKRMLAEKEEK